MTLAKKQAFLNFLIVLLLLMGLSPAASAQDNTVEKIVLFKSQIDTNLIKDLNGTSLEKYSNIPALRVKIPADNLEMLLKNPNIKSVENEQEVQVDGQIQNWGVGAVQSPKMWNSNYTGKNVKIAIVDSGIYPHEDLAIAGGKSFVSYTTSYTDDDGHGTHVAGVIGAKYNNIGIVGVAPDAQLFAVKVLNNKGNGLLSDILAGIDWAITNKMDIINLSLGSMDDSPALKEEIDKAFNSGILVVVAGGNDGNSAGTGDTIAYPAHYSSAISVGAVDNQNVRASFSATGDALSFVAPGVNIVSTWLDNGYAAASGTSMAAPFVSGDLALLKEMYPTASNSQLIDTLKKTAVDLGAPGHDPLYGNGLIQSPLSPTRLSGKDRFEVAVNVSKEGWATSNTVFICNYSAFADALSASPLAYKYDAPILLTGSSELNPLTKQEIARLGARDAIIVGGQGSINESVANAIRQMGVNVQRIDGADRFSVSKNIASELGNSTTAVVASGLNFPDALAIAPYAASHGFPILLTRPDALPADISDLFRNKAFTNTIIVGGEGSVSSNVYNSVPSPTRIGGKDRYEVAANILNQFFPATDKLYIATGSTFADALTGSVLISKDKTGLLLTMKDSVPDATQNILSTRTLGKSIILGGTGSVGNGILSLLNR
jgi:minor extracellular protease Epr